MSFYAPKFLSSVLLDPGMAARDVAQALKSLASAARGVAATTDDSAARSAILDCAGDVMDKSSNLIEETKRAIAKPGGAESQQRLAQVRARPRDYKCFCLVATVVYFWMFICLSYNNDNHHVHVFLCEGG